MGFNLTRIDVNELLCGMVLGENIMNDAAFVLISEGLILNKKIIDKIYSLGLTEVAIRVDDDHTVDRMNEEILDIEEKRSINIEALLNTKVNQQEIVETRAVAIDIIKDTLVNVSSRGSLDVERLRAIVTIIIDQIFENEDIISSLYQLKGIDEYAFEHSLNVTVQAIITGIYLGFNKNRLIKLGIGAILHDLGKMLIEDEILNKPGKLSEDEFKIMKKHSELGHKIAKRISGIEQESLDVILSHHERIDGKGYPLGLKGDQLSVYPKIVAVADVFDALTSDRVYGKKVKDLVAMSYIVEGINNHFDYEVTKKFVIAMAIFPKNLKVKLSTGDYGAVIKHNRGKPVVKVLIDSSGNAVQGYFEIDLETNPSVFITDINPILQNQIDIVVGDSASVK